VLVPVVVVVVDSVVEELSPVVPLLAFCGSNLSKKSARD